MIVIVLFDWWYIIGKLHLNKACGSDAVFALNIKIVHSFIVLVPLLAMCFTRLISHYSKAFDKVNLNLK